jgi:hypothetical protein
MRYFLTVSNDGSEPKESTYYTAFEVDETFHSEVTKVMTILKDIGRAKQL